MFVWFFILKCRCVLWLLKGVWMCCVLIIVWVCVFDCKQVSMHLVFLSRRFD